MRLEYNILFELLRKEKPVLIFLNVRVQKLDKGQLDFVISMDVIFFCFTITFGINSFPILVIYSPKKIIGHTINGQR